METTKTQKELKTYFPSMKKWEIFEEKYTYNGSVCRCSIFGEGTDKHFSLQHLGDHFLFHVLKKNGETIKFNINPKSFKEMIELTEEQFKNNN